jgi:hypothetical protein
MEGAHPIPHSRPSIATAASDPGMDGARRAIREKAREEAKEKK